MKIGLARAIRFWSAALPVVAVTILFAGCIPSEPQTKAVPAPAAAGSVPAATESAVPPAAPTQPPAQSQPSALNRDGQPGASLQIGTAANSNASVTVEAMKDGTGGFSFQGTFNLSGTIVPNGAGKWKLSGQFSVAEPDFAVGTLLASPMGSLGPAGDGGTAGSATLVIIDIPVRPPSAKAAAGTTPRNIPVSMDIDAPSNAQFSVTLTQM